MIVSIKIYERFKMVSIKDVQSMKFFKHEKLVPMSYEEVGSETYSFTASVKNDWSLAVSLKEVLPSGNEYAGRFTLTYDVKYHAEPLKGLLSVKYDEVEEVY